MAPGFLMSGPTYEERNMETYIVTADAVNLTVGKKSNGRPEVRRILRGTEINAEPTDPRIVDLLATKCAVLKSSEAGKRGARVTAKMVAKAMGSPDDPVAKPNEAILPVPAAVAGISLDND